MTGGQGVSSMLFVDVRARRGQFDLRIWLEVDGGVTVLFGPSGSGKSTTLQAIAGLLEPLEGEITLAGRTLFRRRPGETTVNLPARRRRVGLVFQDYALFPHMTALQNIAYSRWRQPDSMGRARGLMERLGLVGLEARYPDQLSGGQQQRVAIARALAASPDVLLLDEPFSALDIETRRLLRGEVRRVLREAGIPVVLVTHDREEALALADRVTVLDAGKAIASGTPVAVLGHPPRERIARLVGVENMWPLAVHARDPAAGTMRCGQGEFRLEVPLADARIGEQVTVAVRADDVLLASVRPVGLSARNVLPGTVIAVEPQGALSTVMLDCGVPVVIHVTQRAVEELDLAPGAQRWVVIKTASCFLLWE